MWKAEEDFPRGGGRTQMVKKNKIVDSKNDSVDQENMEKPGLGKIKTGRKRKLSVQNEQADQMVHKKQKKEKRLIHINVPLHDDLNTELCVLGCVKHASDYSVSVSLPGNLSATLPLTGISPAYMKQLQALAQADDPNILEEVSPVENLFKPGILIPVLIKEINNSQSKKKFIKVSCMPSDVNSGIPVKAINKGQLLFGSISSIEDHGYRVDLGIKSIQAFLAAKDAENLISKLGSPLRVGQPVWCVLKLGDRDSLQAGEIRAINVTVEPDIVSSSQLPETSNLDSIRPGMSVKAVISSVSKYGLLVRVFKFDGSIHSSQLSKSSEQYKAGEEIQAKILYVNPMTKELQLTNLSNHLEFDGTALDLFGELKTGDFVEGKASRILKGKGIYFSLSGKIKGFASISHLSDDEKATQDLSKFPKGQKFRCRVMGFNFMEGIALLSLKQSVLDQKYLSLRDISVGEVVEVYVKDVTLNGLVVKLSKGIYAFISCMHLADVPIKHPEKKFEPGQKLKCRVLKVDLEKSKVMLTHKKSLVKMKDPILTEYSQLRPYMELEGYIIVIKETVVVVSFFNGVQGFVTLKDMSTEKIEDPSSLFYKGQVIRCRVVHYNVEEKRLKLSFNFGEKKESKEKQEDTEFILGKIVKAKVLREESNCFKVQLLPNREQAFLPFYHLSDFHEVQEIRRQAFRPGQIIDKVTYFCANKKTTVTMKESLLQAAQDEVYVKDFDEISVGTLLPAVIKNHQEYGMFLEIAGGLTGLCPTKTMSCLQPASFQDLFLQGQSVTTRITRLDAEKKRFLGSVRLDECYEGGLESGLKHLENYLLAREESTSLLFAEKGELAAYGGLSVGCEVDVTITSVLKKGILGELSSGANALATKHHFGGIEPKVGQTYKALVLFVDPLTPCVELTLEAKVIKAVTALKENSKTKVKSGQVLKADVLLVKPEFMLMCGRAHASGRLVYVPVKQHMNDVDLNSKPYKPGTFTEIVIKDECNGYQLAVLKSKDPDAASKMLDLKNIREHDFKPGTIIEAKIRAVHPLQLNIEAGKTHGRIHITEVEDSPENGTNPLSKYKQGQRVKAVIIGLRDVKSESYLPITHVKAKRTLLECSLKESKLNNPTDKDNLVPKLEVEIGQEVTGFVISTSPQKVWMQVSLAQQGYIEHFHLSSDLEHLNLVKFKPGQTCTATVTNIDSPDRLELSFIGKKLKVEEGADAVAQITSLKPGCSIYVKLPDGRPGVVKSKPTVLHYVGQYIRVMVDQADKLDSCQLSLIEQSTNLLKRQRKRKTSLNEEETKVQEREIIAKKKQLKKEKKKQKVSETGEQGEDSGVDVARESAESDKDQEGEPERRSQVESQEPSEAPRLSISGFSWGEDMSAQAESETKTKDDNEDDDDDDAPVDVKSRKKRKRDEEKLIQEYERSQLDGTALPESASDFEKLALQSPNSSVVWLRYMAFHIELGEVEKARAVAEKALEKISFREEQEKKNVWLAYLNMETQYGDSADVKKLLDRAVTYNDPLDIYLKMCEIYVTANKMEDAEELYIKMTRKFKREKSVWKAYGQFLFKAGRLQSSRNLLQKCTAILDKKDHVEVITKFANLEFTHGDAERGRTMFENLIASYPGRTDIWSVYVDMVAKSGDIAGARDILDRAVKQKFGAKKLSFLIQKMIKFEETHGTDEQVQKVKDMALTLLES